MDMTLFTAALLDLFLNPTSKYSSSTATETIRKYLQLDKDAVPYLRVMQKGSTLQFFTKRNTVRKDAVPSIVIERPDGAMDPKSPILINFHDEIIKLDPEDDVRFITEFKTFMRQIKALLIRLANPTPVLVGQG